MTKKVVINACFGGFGISTKALMLLIKRNAKCIKKTEIVEYYGGSKKYEGKACYSPNWKEKFEEDFKYAKELGDGFYVYGFCKTITDKKYIYDLKDEYNEKGTRMDEDLIKVVEELGVEANGKHAKLKIFEIPKDVEYEIDEYDGAESIHEVHRSWS